MKPATFTGALAAAGLLALTAGTASAQFSGYYAPQNWTFFDNAFGHVDALSAPGSIRVVGGNSGIEGETTFTIQVPVSGTLSFDWSYFSFDDPGYDSSHYLDASFPFGGGWRSLSNTSGESGSISMHVNAGDPIGFRVYTLDGLVAPGELTITNFSAPIPEPGVLGFLALGGMALMRRRAQVRPPA